MNTRLRVNEISTGARLAKQTGMAPADGKYVGEKFVNQAGKTIEAMGQPKAYQHWNSGEFFNSIKDHLNKSVDFVAIDLKGATKAQIKAIKKFVSGLTKKEQERIIYVTLLFRSRLLIGRLMHVVERVVASEAELLHKLVRDDEADYVHRCEQQCLAGEEHYGGCAR